MNVDMVFHVSAHVYIDFTHAHVLVYKLSRACRVSADIHLYQHGDDECSHRVHVHIYSC
jgi:hypothetical protein